jgi:hypothetical protein
MDTAFIIFMAIGVLMFIAYLVGIYYTSYKDYSKKGKNKPS